MDNGVHSYCTNGDTQGKCKDKYYPNEPISCCLSSQIITDTFLVGKYWPAVKTSDLEINGNFPIDFGENRVAARAHQSNFNSFNSHWAFAQPWASVAWVPENCEPSAQGKGRCAPLQHHHFMPDNWLGTILFSTQDKCRIFCLLKETATSHAIIFFSTISFSCWFNLLHT